jgi:tripartite-type tricarboxylate transporter receptor subunit TctC
VTSAEIRKVLLADGTEPAVSSPEELAALIRAELPRWSAAIKLAGVKSE